MRDRKAQERLDDWRSAERAEAEATEGSHAHRRAHATSRRARWAYEDAARAAGIDQGAPAESFGTTMRRAITRLHEASDSAAELTHGRERAERVPETDDQRADRIADEAEIRRELSE